MNGERIYPEPDALDQAIIEKRIGPDAYIALVDADTKRGLYASLQKNLRPLLTFGGFAMLVRAPFFAHQASNFLDMSFQNANPALVQEAVSSAIWALGVLGFSTALFATRHVIDKKVATHVPVFADLSGRHLKDTMLQ